jgi:hypothetical protein
MFHPCFWAVAMTVRITAKSRAPCSARKPPEIFCRSFIMRAACSAGLFVRGRRPAGRWTPSPPPGSGAPRRPHTASGNDPGSRSARPPHAGSPRGDRAVRRTSCPRTPAGSASFGAASSAHRWTAACRCFRCSAPAAATALPRGPLSWPPSPARRPGPHAGRHSLSPGTPSAPPHPRGHDQDRGLGLRS